MISSMDLFFSRDCGGGAGPVVDAPRLALVVCGAAPAAGAVVLEPAAALAAGAVPPPRLEAPAVVVAGAGALEVEDGLDVAVVVVVADVRSAAAGSPGLANRLGPEAALLVVGAEGWAMLGLPKSPEVAPGAPDVAGDDWGALLAEEPVGNWNRDGFGCEEFPPFPAVLWGWAVDAVPILGAPKGLVVLGTPSGWFC